MDRQPRGNNESCCFRSVDDLTLCFLCCGCLQDFPISLAFYYTVSANTSSFSSNAASTTPLLSDPQLSSCLKGARLPAGAAIGVLAVAFDVLGGQSTTAVDESGVPVVVASRPLVLSAASAPDFVTRNKDQLLDQQLQQRKVSSVVSTVGLFGDLLTMSSDPCAHLDCGKHGECYSSTCVCEDGYGGSGCTVALQPTDGYWTPWVTQPCSVSCGNGVQASTRSCVSPQYGGAPCPPGTATQTILCNPGPCTGPEVAGGWTPWSDWTPCPSVSASSSGTALLRTRRRTCTAPAPTLHGEPCSGPAETSGQLGLRGVP